MGIVFKADDPVICDCGCTVYSGWVSEVTLTIFYKGKNRTVVYTHCGEEECAEKSIYEAVSKYMDVEETQIVDKSDKENYYADEQE